MSSLIKTKTTDRFFFVWSPYDSDFVERARGFSARWDSDQRAWRFNVEFIDAARELMRDIYYCDDLTEPEYVTVRATIKNGGIQQTCGAVEMFGKSLSIASGRDSGARVGQDVALISGAIDSGGSRANWTSNVAPRSVFLLTNVVKARFDAERETEEEYASFEVVSASVDKEALQEERARLVARIAEIDALLNE